MYKIQIILWGLFTCWINFFLIIQILDFIEVIIKC